MNKDSTADGLSESHAPAPLRFLRMQRTGGRFLRRFISRKGWIIEAEEIMSKTILITGQAGAGKTAVAAFLIEYLVRKQKGSVLALDAEPYPDLNDYLGSSETVPEGADEQQTEKALTDQSIVEKDGYDLMVLGNESTQDVVASLLKSGYEALAENYKYVIVNTEKDLAEDKAVLNTIKPDRVILVSEDSRKGVGIASEIQKKAAAKKDYLLINKAPNQALTEVVAQAVENSDLNYLGCVPYSPAVAEYISYAQPLTNINPDDPMRRALEEFFAEIF